MRHSAFHFYFRDQLDLDRRAGGQGSHAHRGAGMLATLAQHGDEQIGRAVHHLGLGREVLGAVDEAAHAHDPLHAGKVAHFRAQRGEQLQRALAGRGRALGLGQVASDLAGEVPAVGAAGDLAREKHEVAGAHGGHVVGDGRRHHGQGEAEGREILLGRGRAGGRDENGEQQDGQQHFHAPKAHRRPEARNVETHFTA